jgi:hypothetical protein
VEKDIEAVKFILSCFFKYPHDEQKRNKLIKKKVLQNDMIAVYACIQKKSFRIRFKSFKFKLLQVSNSWIYLICEISVYLVCKLVSHNSNIFSSHIVIWFFCCVFVCSASELKECREVADVELKKLALQNQLLGEELFVCVFNPFSSHIVILFFCCVCVCVCLSAVTRNSSADSAVGMMFLFASVMLLPFQPSLISVCLFVELHTVGDVLDFIKRKFPSFQRQHILNKVCFKNVYFFDFRSFGLIIAVVLVLSFVLSLICFHSEPYYILPRD